MKRGRAALTLTGGEDDDFAGSGAGNDRRGAGQGARDGAEAAVHRRAGCGGHPLAFEREDGASPGRFEIARGKAYGAVMMGLAGSALKQRAEEQPYFMAALNGAYGGRLVPVPGGVPVVRDGRVVGAVGVTGDTSDNDAAVAVAGIEAAGFEARA